MNELQSIAAGGAVRFQGTTDRAVQPVTMNSGAITADMLSSKGFSANPVLTSGLNTETVKASSDGSNFTTNTYKITAAGPSSKTLTNDANGNMTSDGTNSYAWDAENRLIQITYPGSGNNTQFVYDPMGRCVKIEERTSGSLTSTKQHIWCGSQRCEERDGSGNPSKQFFSRGQLNFGSPNVSYFYTLDHLGSIREMTKTVSGTTTIEAQYGYDPYGQVAKISGSQDADFQYAHMFIHPRSGLSLTLFRQYNSGLGRWLSRDPIGITGGQNLYGYVGNSPIRFVDSLGLEAISSLGDALKKACNNPNCNAGDPGTCLEDAEKLATNINKFVNHYMMDSHRGTATHSAARNGFMCWDWAVGLSNLAADNNSFNYNFRQFYENEGEGGHWGIKLTAKPGKGKNAGSDCDCSVNLDDAFGHGFGKGNVHGCTWGPPEGWSEVPKTQLPTRDPDILIRLQNMPWPAQ